MAKDDFIVDKLAVDRDMQFVAIEFLFQQFICLKCWGASEKASTGLVLVYFRENQFDGHLIILLICISGFYFAFFTASPVSGERIILLGENDDRVISQSSGHQLYSQLSTWGRGLNIICGPNWTPNCFAADPSSGDDGD